MITMAEILRSLARHFPARCSWCWRVDRADERGYCPGCGARKAVL